MATRRFATLVTTLAFCSIAATAAAQSTDALVDKYTVIAGSRDNARTLVNGLRTSTDFSIDGTTFDTPTQKLGNGEVNIALSLTEATLSKQSIVTPTPEQLQAALEPILLARAEGKGWGEIANAMGIRLGELMRADRARAEGRLARMERHDRSMERARMERAERPDKPDRPERPERPDKPERPNR
jgi:hypothetical protein